MATEHDRIQDADNWDTWLDDGVPHEAEAHAAGCAACRAVLDDLAVMRLGLHAIAVDTHAEAERVQDVHRPRSRWVIAGGGLAVAVVAAAVLLTAPRVSIDAPAGATLWTSEGPIAISGRIERALPIEIETKATQTVAIDGGYALLPDSRVRIDDDSAHLRYGTLELERDHDTAVIVDSATLLARGTFAVAHGQEHVMTMTNKYKIAGAASVVALLYAGWGQLTNGEDRIEGKGPVALTMSADGTLGREMIGSPESEIPSHASRSNTSALALAAGAAAEEGEAARASGAFWDARSQEMFFALDGEVLDDVSGKPIETFEITAVAIDSKSYGARNKIVRQFRDKADGHFRVEGFGLGEWRVTARAESYAPVSQTVVLRDLSEDPYLVMPMSSGGRLTGRVIDWRGQPVADARVGLVECFERSSKACQIVTTSSGGAFVIEGVPDTDRFAVRAEHDRYGFAIRPNLSKKIGESEHVVIELSGVLRVYGRVTRGVNHVPAAGTVVLDAQSKTQVLADEAGRYELFMPMESRPRIYVESKSREGLTTKFASYPERRSVEAIRWVKADTHVAELEKNFELAMETARLFGRVTDADGQPVGGAELSLHNTTGWHNDRKHETYPERTTTAADGRYAIDGIPAKAGYTVRYESKGGSKKLGYVNIGDEKAVEANFTLGGGTIRGRFVHRESQAPFRTADQSCRRLAAERLGPGGHFVEPRCYDDGRFEFTKLAPGKYILKNRVEWMNSAIQIFEREVVVAPEEIVEGIAVEVEGDEARTWKFRILTEGGRFVPDPFLRYAQGGTSFTSNLNVGNDGVSQFNLSDRYEVVFVEASGYESVKLELAGRSPDAVIAVTMKRHGP